MAVAPQQPSTAARLLTLIAFVLVTAVLYMAREILIPVALAILISFVLHPIVAWLERRGIKRVFGTVFIVFVLISMVGGLGYLVGGQFVDFVDKLPQYKTNITKKMRAVTPGKSSVFKRAEAAIEDFSREMEREETTASETITTPTATTQSIELQAPPAETVRDIASHTVPDAERQDDATRLAAGAITGTVSEAPVEAIPVQVVDGPTTAMQTFQDVLGPVLSILGTAGLVILFVIFFLLQREDLRDRMIRLAGHNKVRVTTEALEEAAKRVSRYLLMQLIINVTYGIPVAVGLYFIGVPNAMLWGVFATILRFIPYIGPWIAAMLPIALSLAVFDNWTMPLLTVGLFVVLELVSNNVLEPILYGHTTGVSPVAIIVSAVFWTWLWGAVGLVLATPITVCLVVLGTYIPQLSFFHVLLGDEPVLTDDARVYNRLLSGATDEALEICETYLKEHDVVKLYDNVLVRALELAEVDRHDEMLSPEKYQRVIVGMTELLEDLCERDDEVDCPDPDADEKSNLAPEALTAGPQRRVMIVPTKDQADELAAAMLKHLLERRGRLVLQSNAGRLASEYVKEASDFNPDIIIISALPPVAVTHTRYICKRIHAELPKPRLVVGLWNVAGGGDKSLERLRDVGVEAVHTSINEAFLHS